MQPQEQNPAAQEQMLRRQILSSVTETQISIAHLRMTFSRAANLEDLSILKALAEKIKAISPDLLRTKERSCVMNPLDSALIRVSEQRRIPAIEFLLDEGAQWHISEEVGNIALHSAIINGHEDVARFILEKGARADKGFPLHEAAKGNMVSLVKPLIDAGADVNATRKNRENEQETALDIAANDLMAIKPNFALELLQNGAKTDPQQCYYLLGSAITHPEGTELSLHLIQHDLCDKEMLSLHDAMHAEREDLVRVLIEKNTDLLWKPDIHSKRPLTAAIENGQPKMVHLLINNGACDSSERQTHVKTARQRKREIENARRERERVITVEEVLQAIGQMQPPPSL